MPIGVFAYARGSRFCARALAAHSATPSSSAIPPQRTPSARFDAERMGMSRDLGHRSLPSQRQRLFGSRRREHVQDPRDDSGPARLVTRPEPGAVVAVEVLVEEQVIAPVRVVLELLRSAEHRAAAVLVAQE